MAGDGNKGKGGKGKSNSSQGKGKSPAKSKGVSKEVRENFERQALSKSWTAQSLTEFAKKILGKGVKAEKGNAKQIAFTLGDERFPKTGHYTIN